MATWRALRLGPLLVRPRRRGLRLWVAQAVGSLAARPLAPLCWVCRGLWDGSWCLVLGYQRSRYTQLVVPLVLGAPQC